MYSMWYSLLIGILLAIALFVYFILSRKLKTPTVTTEILIEKYNKRLKKLESFFKRNKIDLSTADFASRIEKAEIDLEKVKNNLTVIGKIESNNELIEEIFIAQNRQEVEEKAKLFQKNCVLYEFAGELQPNIDVKNLFEMIGYTKTKLDYEKQRYFGSQNFYKIEDKLIFVTNSSALIIDEKNIFESKLTNFEIIIEKNGKNAEKNAQIYAITFKFGQEEVNLNLSVPQKENQKLLNKMIKQHEKTSA